MRYNTLKNSMHGWKTAIYFHQVILHAKMRRNFYEVFRATSNY